MLHQLHAVIAVETLACRVEHDLGEVNADVEAHARREARGAAHMS